MKKEWIRSFVREKRNEIGNHLGDCVLSVLCFLLPLLLSSFYSLELVNMKIED